MSEPKDYGVAHGDCDFMAGYDRGAADERLRIAVHVGNLPSLMGVGKSVIADAVDRAAVIRIIDREPLPPCDYCDDGEALVGGWHIRVDPEGIDPTAKVPCPRAYDRTMHAFAGHGQEAR
jgi:hypothetical protein